VDGGFSWESIPTWPHDPTLDILGTSDDALYLDVAPSTIRYERLGYQIAVPRPASYMVRLHFAELWWGAPGDDPGAAGQRVFDVWAENVPTLIGYDIFASMGAMRATLVEVDVAVAGESLDLWFTTSANAPAVAAVEVVPNGSGAGEAMVAFARRSPGAPYVWATRGPSSFDCSGFTNWVVFNVLGSRSASIGLN